MKISYAHAVAAGTIALTTALPAFAETTLNALFMAQAAYSEADVRAMTDGFHQGQSRRQGQPRIRPL